MRAEATAELAKVKPQARDVVAPLRDPDLLDHDKEWLCRVGEPCAFCE
jgi:hypothetical protein